MKRGLYKTNLEIIMEKALAKEGIKAVYNFPIRCKYGYILDFAIPDKKLCIECDGEHWHPIGNDHDRKRDWVLRKMGWKIIRFRGKEIENHIQQCVEKIKSKVENC